jgi:hypothetical protein
MTWVKQKAKKRKSGRLMSLENLFCKNTGKTLIVLCVMAVNLFTGCGYHENAQVYSKVDLNSNTAKEENMLKFFINDEEIQVIWEENESVEALKNLAEDQPISIDMSMYGDFEQVGSIGQSIPRNDKQMTTSAGDIVLYSGNQLVVFYGSNSWAYTKLGHIDNTSAEEMKKRLGSGDVNVTISITE